MVIVENEDNSALYKQFFINIFLFMIINILLPIPPICPSGGIKVAFEYANRMAEHGFSVNIIIPIELKLSVAQNPSLIIRLKMLKKSITKRIKNSYTSKFWFQLHPSINQKLVPCLSEKYIPISDFTFATSWETAEWLNTYSAARGKKIYLIQHFENWSGTDAEVINTWKMPFKRVVISNWLKNIAISIGEDAKIINNGLDFNKFNIITPIEDRNPYQIIMLYHDLRWKGSAFGIKALEIAKKKHPKIEAILYSTCTKPKNLPHWINFIQSPSNLNELYNKSSIFITPSLSEGWALPPAEAMMCGCAVILTDIEGHRDYVKNKEYLLFVEPESAGSIADAIDFFIANNKKRIEIANQGNLCIQEFTWESAFEKMLTVMFEN